MAGIRVTMQRDGDDAVVGTGFADGDEGACSRESETRGLLEEGFWRSARDYIFDDGDLLGRW